MIRKKGGLGRGLDALLGATARSETPPDPAASETLRQLSVDCIQRGRYQPRQDLREDTLRELADSIRA
ncbi:MAG: chromosome partitioning protein ParB, partial [Candidatus Competibacter sp.]|nr:chromosome partitioning protein ParB [Candidatus Competibacter sp.]